MTSWATLPALRLALAAAGGIAIGGALPPELAYATSSLAGLLGLALLAWPRPSAQAPGLRGAGVLLLCSATGILAQVTSRPPLAPLDAGGVAYSQVRIDELHRGEGWSKADVTVYRVRANGTWVDTLVGARLMLSPEVDLAPLRPGAVLLTSAAWQALRPPANPGAFDYRAYLHGRGISAQAFARPAELHLLRAGPDPGSIATLRAAIAARLGSAVPTPQAAGVARALVLGDRAGLDEDTRAAYAHSGAMHVLAVSGLHTGVVAAILAWLLAPLRRAGRGGRVAALLALWAGLAAYAALTDFAPSVRRSAVMFGALFAGRTLRADGNPLNSLGLSALILLLLDPSLLRALGFQLSYAAVAGIIVFYPPLKRAMRSRFPVLDRVADLVAVSLAATVATAPLTVYHFHQFPLAFAVSGVVAVPLVSLALPLLLGGLVVDFAFGLFAIDAAWALLPGVLAIEACTRGLAALATLPGALVTQLWPSPLSVVCSYGGLVFAGAYALRRRPRLALAAAGCFLAAGGATAFATVAKRSTRAIVTYGLRDAIVVDLVAGGQAMTLSPKPAPPHTLQREVLPNQLRLGLTLASGSGRYASRAGQSALRGYAAAGYRWATLTGDVPRRLPRTGPELDWLVIEDASRLNPDEVAAAFPHSRLLLTRRPPPWQTDAWAALGPRAHVLPTDGAFAVAAYPRGG